MTQAELSANFDLSHEQQIYERWEASGCFEPDYSREQAFSIVLPPPNVTGSLHMGHGFNNTIMDALTRYHRMKGFNVLWQPGTDHAGIATQTVVERQLGLEGVTRHDLGREAFLDKVWEWKETSGGRITSQIRRLGSSVDWSRERFTLDEGLSKTVTEVFVRLFDDGLIYRGKRLVNWDPVLTTALSDLEVNHTERKGSLWHFKYFFTDSSISTSDGKNYIVVATTRPETLLGDTAVAVHPKDERYAHLIGKTLTLPVTGRVIPIVADDHVEQDFGSGCVKITPAHDFNDYEIGKRHNLKLINLLGEDACVLEQMEVYPTLATKEPEFEAAPAAYAGLTREAARELIVEHAESEGWLETIEPYDLKAPLSERSGVVVEPRLTDQWYVAVEKLAGPAIEAVETGDIEFVPGQYKNMYMSWMNNLQDWCISRQLWWGHRIPAWYSEDGQIFVGRDEAEVRAKYDLTADVTLTQDEDVLDTWFSSALWTFSTLGWPENTDALKAFHPTSVLVTGFDIIFFWVARMIMMSLYLVKDESGRAQVPFKTVYVHGLVRDENGQKMSKSKGNVIDPIDVIDGIDLETLVAKRTTGLMNPKAAPKIEKATRKEFEEGIASYGTDALRFTFASLASTGRDINFSMGRVEGYRNFCNKIWNAGKFVLMQVERHGIAETSDTAQHGLAERWVLSQLDQTTAQVHAAFATYRLDLAASRLYEFTWNTFCDWYLELAKADLIASESAEHKQQITRVLVEVLEAVLRLAHPIMPYITEELWQVLAPLVQAKSAGTIMLASYPTDQSRANPQTDQDMQWLQELIGAVRNLRAELKVSPATSVPVLLEHVTDEQNTSLSRVQASFKAMAKVAELSVNPTDTPMSVSAQVGDVTVLIPMAGLVDVAAETARLTKSLDKLAQQSGALKGKLSNPGFTDKAPAAVVEAERAKLAEVGSQIDRIHAQIESLKQL